MVAELAVIPPAVLAMVAEEVFRSLKKNARLLS